MTDVAFNLMNDISEGYIAGEDEEEIQADEEGGDASIRIGRIQIGIPKSLRRR
ncbi:uncharacterized protein FRV6_16612 [Fusarium oxysporum]|uniref:Uncharacterized protein n=1 Tax=Fusarium oxysporum TaxID=5507 RepID=A0A2H3TV43_FUSOX|nr:uncharacterized protein FRV6_16612 [Fusarium oxysporum]